MPASATNATPSLDPHAQALPRRFGPYTLFAPIGRGGMAELFLARAETELGATKLAVVKLILPAFAEDPHFAEMLIHEAKLAASLSHRHIVQVHDLGRDEGHLYIAMEYVEGLDLNALLRKCSEKGEGLPAEFALGIVADVLEGLDYAHRRPQGIVHRDVSPSNILISYEGEVKLCDFGIAHANDLVREGATDALKGKAGYMSPEHASGQALDARADVFAAGIILWELLAGRRLYRIRSDVPLLEQARRAEIPPVPYKSLPHQEELERIVARALAKERADRYPTAGAFQRDLEGYLAKAGMLASRLKLGEWMAATFGTELIDERRASERLLPKSAVPPRASGAVRRAAPAMQSEVVPAAPRVPDDLVVTIAQEESIPLQLPAVSSASMDPEPPAEETAPAEDAKPSTVVVRETDAEIVAWARKRGYLSLAFFALCAVLIAIVWFASR